MDTEKAALLRAIDKVGGQSELARRLTVIMERQIAQGHISYWLKKGVSAEGALAVAEACEWSETPHKLLAAIYRHPSDGMPAHLRNTPPSEPARQVA